MKLLIIGNGGTGKSTLAERLGRELGIQATHLDTLGFGKNWVRVDENEFKKKLSSILAGNDWIIDGWSYQSTMKTRIEAAEIIIYLKFNIWSCYWNALKRHIQYTFKYNSYDPPESWIWRKTIRMVRQCGGFIKYTNLR
ncbi:MAG: topology modulation protein [Chlorobi bacterium]|nr:topology modulation protein [Chlorobiota bacterium]MCI0716266.1 topology modulation protein [Chlorobiota bacterium]